MNFIAKLSLGFCLIGLVIACDNPIIQGDGCHDDIIETSLLVNKKIMDSTDINISPDDISFLKIIPGNNLIATYNFIAAQCDNTDDDEYGYFYAIEIETDDNSFTYNINENSAVKHYFYEWGAWVQSIPTQPKSGTISGTKKDDDRWDISADLIVERLFNSEDLNLKFDHSFSK